VGCDRRHTVFLGGRELAYILTPKLAMGTWLAIVSRWGVHKSSRLCVGDTIDGNGEILFLKVS
jgi:hypothetical protein